MNRLFIVDPSLKDLRGHHYNLTQAATASAQELGFDVTWLCSTELECAIEIDGVTVDPVFQSSMYQQYKLPTGTEKKRRSIFGRFWGKRKSSNVKPVDQEQQFIDDLRAALANHKVNRKDRILIHTADGIIFRAIGQLFLEGDPATLPCFHVATPYNPTGIMPNKGDASKIDESIAALRDAGFIGSQIFLYGENAPLSEHLATHWGTRVQPLGLPVDVPTTKAIERALVYRRETLGLDDDVFLVVSLGSARLEKGFDQFPAIIEALDEQLRTHHADQPVQPKIKFVLHASPQIIGRHPKISETIDALKSMPGDLVELKLEPLSEDEYENLLFASHAVIMPYTKKDYALRGSMIVTEAIVAGKSIIATEGTYPGYAASRMYGRTARNPAEFAEAILATAMNQANTMPEFDQARVDFIEQNARSKYWQKCLDVEKG